MAGNPGDYSAIFATVRLTILEDEAILLSRTLDADGAPAQASLVRQAYLRLLRELEQIAREISQVAEQYIKQEEEATRVRPDTFGSGGPRLNDFVGRSHPLPGVEGSVGVNYEPALYQNVPWWWTNEEGYSGHIGRVTTGFFFDAGFTNPSHPDPSRFREHPLFAPNTRGAGGAGPRGGKGRRGTIRNPIPARRFVERGASRAEAEWRRRVRAARIRFMQECDRALAQAPPPRRRRRGRPAGPGRRP